MNKKLLSFVGVFVLSCIMFSETALARKYQSNGYYEQDVYAQPYYPEDEVVYVEERGDRGRSVAKGVGIGAVGGGLLGLAASGGKGKGFGYGALAGAGLGGLMGGAFGGRKKRYRRVRRPRRVYYDGY